MTIYLTNAGSATAVKRGVATPATRACVGPGPVLSIMRAPRPAYAECGTGRVLALTPPLHLYEPAFAARAAADDDAARTAAWTAYEAALVESWTPNLRRMVPGMLGWGLPAHYVDEDALRWDGELWTRRGAVPDGATLICSCAREVAARGLCHRVPAARMLVAAGWAVVLDGVEVVA